MKFVKQFVALSVLFALLTTLTACNTAEGLGKDTQKAGEKIENAADRNK